MFWRYTWRQSEPRQIRLTSRNGCLSPNLQTIFLPAARKGYVQRVPLLMKPTPMCLLVLSLVSIVNQRHKVAMGIEI
ncbi:protein of unknown function [Burkholderia multivorans]